MLLLLLYIYIYNILLVLGEPNKNCTELRNFFNHNNNNNNNNNNNVKNLLNIQNNCDIDNENFKFLVENGHLTTIDLTDNQLKGELYILQSLINIRARNNSLTSLSVIDKINYNLEEFFLSGNKKITSIPSTIKNLKHLNTLVINDTNIKEISNEIFRLPLQVLAIDNNPNLQMKIINFNTMVSKCYFKNTNILCYQPGTCRYIDENPSKYRECTQKEIDEINNSIKKESIYNNIKKRNNKSDSKLDDNNNNDNKDNDNNSSLYMKLLMSIGILILILISGIIIYYYIRYRIYRHKKNIINDIINERFKLRKGNIYEGVNQNENSQYSSEEISMNSIQNGDYHRIKSNQTSSSSILNTISVIRDVLYIFNFLN
ncbi:hypothetical protein BCR32DRAFT_265650 [Anaeromyces robustus]|uniref:L domain-like protein n=1 Tax=Anaeromyces robustus TaxID=1754192 RepID=A0A1Y1XI93_9FUNG|nr:hypothetical protein BCR32DRAFT_265650 [Anaeromyces robustus]|eukprot:ORX85479.1 hypothetical protein BCR32DRAFT_265650 [Anaeromyces robustus]